MVTHPVELTTRHLACRTQEKIPVVQPVRRRETPRQWSQIGRVRIPRTGLLPTGQMACQCPKLCNARHLLQNQAIRALRRLSN